MQFRADLKKSCQSTAIIFYLLSLLLERERMTLKHAWLHVHSYSVPASNTSVYFCDSTTACNVRKNHQVTVHLHQLLLEGISGCNAQERQREVTKMLCTCSCNHKCKIKVKVEAILHQVICRTPDKAYGKLSLCTTGDTNVSTFLLELGPNQAVQIEKGG